VRIPGIATAGGDMGGSGGASLPEAGKRTESSMGVEAPAAAPPRPPPTPSSPTGPTRTPRLSPNAAFSMCSAGVVAADLTLSRRRMRRMAKGSGGGRKKPQTVTLLPSADGVSRRKQGGEGWNSVEELGAAVGLWLAGWGWRARKRPPTATATTWPPAELSPRLLETTGEEEGHRHMGKPGSGDRCTGQTCDGGR